MTTIRSLLITAGAIIAGAGGCDHSRPGGERSAEPSSDTLESSPSAVITSGHPGVVDGIARARCAREERCGNIGQGKKWPMLDGCTRQITSDWRDELNAFECPGGIDEKELDECMRAIRNENCTSPLDALRRIVACRSGDICRATLSRRRP